MANASAHYRSLHAARPLIQSPPEHPATRMAFIQGLMLHFACLLFLLSGGD
jgi:hypothetical protein